MVFTLSSRNPDHDLVRRDAVVIGLVNNMPDAALRTTEQQFCGLLSAAARGRAISLRFFYLADLPRGPEAREYLRRRYAEIGGQWEGRLDGLIVTGAEPRTAALSDESYWPALAKLVEWADDHTISSVWSCLAAHAAVLHADGIERRRMRGKLFGLFDCKKSADDPLLAGVPSRWKVPHSRYHDLPVEALANKGYCVLSRSEAAGADMFAKRRSSLFVFLQGHPEYDGGALPREYRRDVRRFLSGQLEAYPEMPGGYFDDLTAAALDALKARVLHDCDAGVLRDFPIVTAQEKTACGWRQLAVQFYSNWLSYLMEHKHLARGPQVSGGSASPPRLPAAH